MITEGFGKFKALGRGLKPRQSLPTKVFLAVTES